MASGFYRAAGLVLGVIGVLWTFFGPVDSSVKQHAPEGIAVFAVLYVIAQGAERLVEFVLAFLNLFPDSPGTRKADSLRDLGKANSTLNGNPPLEAFDTAKAAKDEAAEKLETARADTAFVGLGLSLLLSALAVNALNYGLFDSLGTTGVDGDLDRFITALAAAGGSKAVHELVGRMQKAKEAAETTAKTA